MTRTKAADTKGRETNGKRRESEGRARGQTKKIIGGILGETGKDKMYEERGEGMRKKGKETNDKRNTGRDEGDEGHKDKGAGPRQREEGREEERGETEKGGGTYQDQDDGGSDGRYSYPLVVPRLGEVPDDSTVVQCTGTDHSAVHYHGTMDNPPPFPAPGRRRRDRQRQRHPSRTARQGRRPPRPARQRPHQGGRQEEG